MTKPGKNLQQAISEVDRCRNLYARSLKLKDATRLLAFHDRLERGDLQLIEPESALHFLFDKEVAKPDSKRDMDNVLGLAREIRAFAAVRSRLELAKHQIARDRGMFQFIEDFVGAMLRHVSDPILIRAVLAEVEMLMAKSNLTEEVNHSLPMLITTIDKEVETLTQRGLPSYGCTSEEEVVDSEEEFEADDISGG